jgi:hypothetical protein
MTHGLAEVARELFGQGGHSLAGGVQRAARVHEPTRRTEDRRKEKERGGGREREREREIERERERGRESEGERKRERDNVRLALTSIDAFPNTANTTTALFADRSSRSSEASI